MKRTLLIIFILFLMMQLIQVEKINPTSDKNLEITAPQNIQTMLKTSCFDCHSNHTVWPWYSNVAPMSWIIQDHVVNGRKALNFSLWNEYNDDEKKKKKKKIYRAVYGAMPLDSYLSAHDEAKLTKEQREIIRTWTGARR